MSNLMKTLTIGSSSYEVCDASARNDLENKVSYNVQSLTVDQQAQVRSNIDAATPAYVDTAKAEAKTYTNSQVKKAAPRNLLDNSDFRNPVNQRGQTLYREAGYTIDRWYKESGADVTLSDTGIHIDNFAGTKEEVFIQKADRKTADYLIGRQVTLAIKTEEGVFCGSGIVSVDSLTVVVYGAGWTLMLQFFTESSSYQVARLIVNSGASILVEWIALYEGEYTAETLPEYQPKDYGAELAECMRYFQILDNIKLIGVLYTPNGDTRLNIPFLVPMRTIPTVLINETVSVLAVGANDTHVNFEIQISSLDVRSDRICNMQISNHADLQRLSEVVIIGSTTVKIAASADL